MKKSGHKNYFIVAKWYIVWQVPEQVNRKCPLDTRFDNFQPPIPNLFRQSPHPQHLEILLLYLASLATRPFCLHCYEHGKVLLSRWWLTNASHSTTGYLSNNWASFSFNKTWKSIFFKTIFQRLHLSISEYQTNGWYRTVYWTLYPIIFVTWLYTCHLPIKGYLTLLGNRLLNYWAKGRKD